MQRCTLLTALCADVPSSMQAGRANCMLLQSHILIAAPCSLGQYLMWMQHQSTGGVLPGAAVGKPCRFARGLCLQGRCAG